MTDLVTLDDPGGEGLKVLLELHRGVVAHEVDEGVAQTDLCLKVHGQVHQVVGSQEAFPVQKIEQHVARVVVRNVAHHHCGRRVPQSSLRAIASR
eukprot:CAMPEP_0170623834 /NCGR_PEP_ID=MMETSP0224-20130122/29910_1 /TAXON_ID=285029 /ORGANISM="Togula jolla, Strain CCCM 725" /LENGTH=94 /DNA_ID=CAMNT_0010950315 /DNA_START=1131 /DNA_END=1415 /DNA_ORIENTATION=-